MDQPIIHELNKLHEKAGIEIPVLVYTADGRPDEDILLASLKMLNASYDKPAALTQIRKLMERYNIQIDEIAESIMR